ncbi:MAG: hypothetical protein KKH29_02340 [Candidatus Omnitrophica bacterium]|nr:hypothetical protein [Candidatus Omnitrophota bacterium]MBU4473598.1 hypothetical protein [Candidatus Omnitrophota bacterium]MCG2706315.1 hypothetical protein [Candidatus Omnitrophota bacterium]
MKPQIKDISDIIYQSELTPHPASSKESYGFLGEGLNSQTASPTTYVHLRSISRLLI